MRNWLTFDGVSLKDFGVYINGGGTFNAPARSREVISVPGRNGDLIIDNGRYENTDVVYHAFIYRDFSVNVEGLRNLLLSRTGYVRIEDTYHPDEFRMGVYTGNFQADVVDWLEAGEFDLTFNCKPQRFLKSGEEKIRVAYYAGGYLETTILNETTQIAKPLLYISRSSGSHDATLSIGGKTLTIAGISQTSGSQLLVDCDLMDAYKTDGTNMNQYISGDFPVLVPGENVITANDRIAAVDMWPRWWKL